MVIPAPGPMVGNWDADNIRGLTSCDCCLSYSRCLGWARGRQLRLVPDARSRQKKMHPYKSRRPESQVIKRDVMDTLKSRIRDWGEHATIISGRFMAGKTVAVEEALRGTRGVFRFCIKVADWESLMYQKLGVKDANMFEQVLRRVRKRLAKLPENPTKFPILLLDIPRETPTGRSLVSFKTINLKSISFKVSSREAPWAWFLPRRRSLQAMQPMMFQFMSRPLLSKFEVGRSP